MSNSIAAMSSVTGLSAAQLAPSIVSSNIHTTGFEPSPFSTPSVTITRTSSATASATSTPSPAAAASSALPVIGAVIGVLAGLGIVGASAAYCLGVCGAAKSKRRKALDGAARTKKRKPT